MEQDIEIPKDITDQNVSGMSREENQQFDMSKRNIKSDVDLVFKTYPHLNTINFEDFSSSLMKSLVNINHNVSHSQFEAIKSITVKNKYLKLAENMKVPNNPYADGLDASEQAIKSLIAVITWQKIATDVLLMGWEKLLEILGEMKGVQHEKLKSDVEKESRNDLIKAQKEMFADLMEKQKNMYEAQILSTAKIKSEVHEVNIEDDERYEKVMEDNKKLSQDLSEVKKMIASMLAVPMQTSPKPKQYSDEEIINREEVIRKARSEAIRKRLEENKHMGERDENDTR